MALQLSKQVEKVLDYLQNIDVSEIQNEVDAGRAFYEKMIPLAGERETSLEVEDLEIPGSESRISIRIYRPCNKLHQPAVLFIHGGWFFMGSLNTHDTVLRKLAKLSQAVIIAVGYRLAPEYPFPNGLNDCYDTLKLIINNAQQLGIDATRLAIAGDSAGGALAATITRLTVENNLQGILCQALIYPVTAVSLTTQSWSDFKDGPVLNYEGAVTALNYYLPDLKDRENPSAVPLLAQSFSGTPHTLIIVAEYDPLRDEAIEYAEKLKKEGALVKLSQYKGMVHGFFQLGGIINEGNMAIEEVAEFLKQQLAQ